MYVCMCRCICIRNTLFVGRPKQANDNVAAMRA